MAEGRWLMPLQLKWPAPRPPPHPPPSTTTQHAEGPTLAHAVAAEVTPVHRLAGARQPEGVGGGGPPAMADQVVHRALVPAPMWEGSGQILLQVRISRQGAHPALHRVLVPASIRVGGCVGGGGEQILIRAGQGRAGSCTAPGTPRWPSWKTAQWEI